jgi:hypothetical protein
MDITQLAIAGVVAVGMLVVALLAIVPTLSELPGSHRRHDVRSPTPPSSPVKVDHHSVPR